jgi:hypothetical protein
VIVGDLSKIEQPVRALHLGAIQVVDADGKPWRRRWRPHEVSTAHRRFSQPRQAGDNPACRFFGPPRLELPCAMPCSSSPP